MSSEANDLSEKEKKTTITPEHVLAALEQLGFAEFQQDVRAFYGDVKESNAQRGAGRTLLPSPCACPAPYAAQAQAAAVAGAQRGSSRKTRAEQSGLSEAEQARLPLFGGTCACCPTRRRQRT